MEIINNLKWSLEEVTNFIQPFINDLTIQNIVKAGFKQIIKGNIQIDPVSVMNILKDMTSDFNKYKMKIIPVFKIVGKWFETNKSFIAPLLKWCFVGTVVGAGFVAIGYVIYRIVPELVDWLCQKLFGKSMEQIGKDAIVDETKKMKLKYEKQCSDDYYFSEEEIISSSTNFDEDNEDYRKLYSKYIQNNVTVNANCVNEDEMRRKLECYFDKEIGPALGFFERKKCKKEYVENELKRLLNQDQREYQFEEQNDYEIELNERNRLIKEFDNEFASTLYSYEIESWKREYVETRLQTFIETNGLIDYSDELLNDI